ncbi:uncharacterized protein LOC105182716 isoform X2 [Harpegnathos saltator]|uniref:uncharacterized protein LOC105182716 isoform X2 n=1 Tax=Harpegnathos saltator TaxID=610380 RepID=UPI000DBED90A|nr:uncharacterized protein LOC105182716 isoform X2 [Harpegnathos saltator]
MENNVLLIPAPAKEYFLHRRIVHAVVIHQRAAKFVEYLKSDIMAPYTLLIIIGVSSLSLNLFRFLQLIILMDNINELFIFAVLLMTHFGYMFIPNYGGQEMLEHGTELFRTTYNVPWYAAPLRTQKLLLIIMQKGTRNVTLTCGGIFIASLECLTSLISTAVSYFTVIYSTR